MIKKDRCTSSYERYIRKFADGLINLKILDIGCGTGNYTKLFCKNNNNVYGVDIADFRMDAYKADFDYVKYDGRKLPFKDGEFDVVVSFDVIEHVEDDFNFAKEIMRVLNINGKLLIATPNRNRLSNILYRLIGNPIKYPYVICEGGDLGRLIHIREYTGKELCDLFRRAGLNTGLVDSFWFGLRGNVDFGTDRFFLKQIAQYLFLINK